MVRALKVFRMPIGFHDAYVAAPSRKAALAAWGADRDLFARGVAEEVKDAALMAEPLASPGEVIRRSRGSAAEQLAALPAEPPKPGGDKRAKPAAGSKPKRPKPDRARLAEVDRALEEAEAEARCSERDFDRRAASLARERREAGERHDKGIAKLQREREDVAAAYDRAMAAWRDEDGS